MATHVINGGHIDITRPDADHLVLRAADNDVSVSLHKISPIEVGGIAGELIRHFGTFIERPLEAIICVLQEKQEQEPCRETAIILTKLEEALMWQDKRKQRKDLEHRKKLYDDDVRDNCEPLPRETPDVLAHMAEDIVTTLGDLNSPWRHKRSGTKYHLFDISFDEQTLVPRVTYYQSNNPGVRFSRPLPIFLEKFVPWVEVEFTHVMSSESPEKEIEDWRHTSSSVEELAATPFHEIEDKLTPVTDAVIASDANPTPCALQEADSLSDKSMTSAIRAVAATMAAEEAALQPAATPFSGNPVYNNGAGPMGTFWVSKAEYDTGEYETVLRVVGRTKNSDTPMLYITEWFDAERNEVVRGNPLDGGELAEQYVRIGEIGNEPTLLKAQKKYRPGAMFRRTSKSLDGDGLVDVITKLVVNVKTDEVRVRYTYPGTATNYTTSLEQWERDWERMVSNVDLPARGSLWFTRGAPYTSEGLTEILDTYEDPTNGDIYVIYRSHAKFTGHNRPQMRSLADWESVFKTTCEAESWAARVASVLPVGAEFTSLTRNGKRHHLRIEQYITREGSQDVAVKLLLEHNGDREYRIIKVQELYYRYTVPMK